jgi:hypothetical protein
VDRATPETAATNREAEAPWVTRPRPGDDKLTYSTFAGIGRSGDELRLDVPTYYSSIAGPSRAADVGMYDGCG